MQLNLFKNAFLIRDELGYGYHKDLPKPLTADETDNSVQLQLEDLGYEVAYVKGPKTSAADKKKALAEGTYVSPDVSKWNPKPPAAKKIKPLSAEQKAKLLEAQKGGEAAKGLPRDEKTKDLLSTDPWVLAAVYDTDSQGVIAMFVRKKVQKADTPEERELKEKKRRERTEITADDRISGHNGIL